MSEEDIREFSKKFDDLAMRQMRYVEEHHRLEKEIVELKSDINYIRKSQDSLNENINRILFILGGGFIAALVTWVVRGGLSG